jgi:hypothetical protein
MGEPLRGRRRVSAINPASATPSKIRGRAELGLYLRLNAASNPSSTSWRLVRSIWQCWCPALRRSGCRSSLRQTPMRPPSAGCGLSSAAGRNAGQPRPRRDLWVPDRRVRPRCLVDRGSADRARRALRLQRLAVSEREDPFAAVIRCTTDPAKADKRTRSKWSRVLRYAAVYKADSEPLDHFIRRKGGINSCAGRFSGCLGRGAARRCP